MKKYMFLNINSSESAGAVGKNDSGSYFRINFDQPVSLPREAKNAQMQVTNGSFWNTFPNILDSNNKIYIYTERAPEEVITNDDDLFENVPDLTFSLYLYANAGGPVIDLTSNSNKINVSRDKHIFLANDFIIFHYQGQVIEVTVQSVLSISTNQIRLKLTSEIPILPTINNEVISFYRKRSDAQILPMDSSFNSSSMVLANDHLTFAGDNLEVGDIEVGDSVRVYDSANNIVADLYIYEKNFFPSTDGVGGILSLRTSTIYELTAPVGSVHFDVVKGLHPPHVIEIPKGQYNLNSLEQKLEIELAKSGLDLPIAFSANTATQKIIIEFLKPNVTIDFTPVDAIDILGFERKAYGPYHREKKIEAPLVAQINRVNGLLLHTDLIENGIRTNDSFSSTLAVVPISSWAGDQVVYEPLNPSIVPCDNLVGQNRTSARFWLTNYQNKDIIDTNGENYSFTIKISYEI